MKTSNAVILEKISNVHEDIKEVKDRLGKINSSIEKHAEKITKAETRMETHSKAIWGIIAFIGTILGTVITWFWKR